MFAAPSAARASWSSAGQARECISGLRDQVQHTLRKHHADNSHPAGRFTIESINEPHPAYA